MAQCLSDSFVSDCFLHMIAVAPKMNSQLFELIKLVMEDFTACKDSDFMKNMNDKVRNNLTSVISICRGLAALMKPDVS